MDEHAFQVWLHIVLTLVALCLPVPFCVFYRHGPWRTLGEVFDALWPYMLFFLFSACLLCTGGRPLQEWLFPAFGSLALVVFCRDNRIYRIGWWLLMGLAIVLCLNFLVLVYPSSDYVRDVKLTLEFENINAQIAKNDVKKVLESKYPPVWRIDPGPVAKILDDPAYDDLVIVTAEPEWHSNVTMLRRLKRQKASLWYPGGEIHSGLQNLELRPLD